MKSWSLHLYTGTQCSKHRGWKNAVAWKNLMYQYFGILHLGRNARKNSKPKVSGLKISYNHRGINLHTGELWHFVHSHKSVAKDAAETAVSILWISTDRGGKHPVIHSLLFVCYLYSTVLWNPVQKIQYKQIYIFCLYDEGSFMVFVKDDGLQIQTFSSQIPHGNKTTLLNLQFQLPLCSFAKNTKEKIKPNFSFSQSCRVVS